MHGNDPGGNVTVNPPMCRACSWLIFVLVLSCVATGGHLATLDPERHREATGAHGAVATAHGLASEAALGVLKRGGNAMDAAVAASFVISVVRPQSTGIGGGGFLLWHDAKTGNVEALDFRERAPAAATRGMFATADSMNGHLAVGTPGLVAGLYEAHKRHGSLPWATLVEPAIKIADDGFAAYPGLAEASKERAEILARYPASAALFLPNGKPLAAGDVVRQPDLAWTLRQIATRGAEGFYGGPVRDRLLAEIKRGGGIIAAADLDGYRVKERTPVSGLYHGYRVVSMPPPSSGGALVVQMLNMLAHDDFPAMGFQTVRPLHLIAETMRRAFADRAQWLGDPDFIAVPLRGLLSLNYAAERRRSIDMARATPSSAVLAGDPASVRESASTTHLSVVDAAGNAVATTQTVNFTFGSCVVAAGTGIVLNDEMDDFATKPGEPNAFGLVGAEANAVAPLKTMLSSMSPTIVFGKDGKLLLALGSPGGPRIISAVFQTILNALAYEMPLAAAVAAPRIHHQWLPDSLRVERGTLSADVLSGLRARGHTLLEAGPIGDVQAIRRAPGSAVLEAVSDTRSEGEARAF